MNIKICKQMQKLQKNLFAQGDAQRHIIGLPNSNLKHFIEDIIIQTKKFSFYAFHRE